ncbi:MAG: spore coat protein [Candidatus Syntrophonatronum acetioxidans]|uniref:Spore coat protein n=1 Tax=Candidatus Syntrophonatronum acetioxidans TaxID=1795816 RepID=A0A424YE05_9FIRM|nr:MAG: spore coat protein [Candidatus Syntrophonatronum acetioxidans]
MNDIDRIIDSLKDAKFMSNYYNGLAMESTRPEIRNLFLKLLKDEQDHARTLSFLLQRITIRE